MCGVTAGLGSFLRDVGMNDIGPDDTDNIHISVGNVDSAILELQNLIRHLPLTIEEAAAGLEDLTPDVPDILKVYVDEIRSRLEDEIRRKFEYGLEDCSVERNSDYENDFYRLITRLETYREITSFQGVLEKIDTRLSRIDEVWPPLHFNFKTIQKDLDAIYLSNNVIENIDNAIKAFDDGRFTDAVNNCGHSAKAIVGGFCGLLKIECEGDKFYNQINRIRKHLEHTSHKSPTELEWYVIFLVSVSYWLRNAEAHKEESIGERPTWKDDYRKKQIRRVENARVALVCTLQAAKELQKLIEMDRCSETTT